MSSAFSKSSVFFCQHVHVKTAFSKSSVFIDRFLIRVNGSRIGKEKVAFSNENGYMWTYSLIHTNHERSKFQRFQVQIANCQYNRQKGPITYAVEAMLMNSVLPACPVSCLVPPGRPASVITWKISTRDLGITLSGSQLTRLARSSYNRKVDFCCVELRCGISSRRASLAHIIRPYQFYIVSFYAFPLTSPIFQSPRGHSRNFTPLNIFTPPSLY